MQHSERRTTLTSATTADGLEIVEETDGTPADLIGERESELHASGTTTKIGSLDVQVRELPKDIEHTLIPVINPAYKFNASYIDDIIMDIKERRPICLTGHAGTGKTTLPEQICARTNQSVLRINMNGQATVSDLVGKWAVRGGETYWIDGALPRAMRNGWHLIIDEADYAEPTMMSPLNGPSERGGKLFLKERDGEIITPAPGFQLWFTGNTIGCMEKYRHLYPGTKIMNDALKDRLRMYLIEYLPPDQEAQMLVETVPRCNPKIAKPLVMIAGMIREAFRKEEIKATFGTRKLIDWAEMTIRVKDPLKAAGPTVFHKVLDDDRKVIEGIVARLTTKKGS
jgi:cobaltochelatase CobS